MTIEEPLIAPNENDKLDAIIPQEQLDEYKKLLAVKAPKWQFEIVHGFFKQSDPDTDDTVFDCAKSHFGRETASWDDLKAKLGALNASADENTKYKLVYCARHGQGYHNRCVEIVGIDAWNEHWSSLYSGELPNGEHLTWGPDPFLTDKGKAQAQLMNDAFKAELDDGCPLPTKLFSSPFTRSAQTLAITWNGILMCKDESLAAKMHPMVKEDLRETIGHNTCDKRSTKSIFLERMKGWGFEHEPGFPEHDTLYRDDWREPFYEQAIRANSFLQDVFEEHDDEVVYCASHAGEVKGLVMATGHRSFIIPTAGMIPMLVKATVAN